MKADPSKADVLVIEDELQVRRLLRLILGEAGYTVREAETGQAGIEEALRKNPDLVILDLELPDRKGIDVLKHLREWSEVPVVVLSGLDEEIYKIAALDAGADDYVMKPFGTGELLARLRALLRRIKPAVATSVFQFGAVEIDFGRRLVTKNRKPVKLTSREYAMLQLLIAHRGKVLTHRQILRELWGPRAERQTHYLRTYMLRLRRKLEDDGDAPRYFQTDSGIGYRFVHNQMESLLNGSG